MAITPHMLVGAVIGAHSPNLLTAFCLGLLGHYLLDLLPHWDYLSKIKITRPDHLKKIGLDFILGAMVVLALIWSYPEKIFILTSIIASLLPDCLLALDDTFKIKWLEPLSWFHKKIHFKRLPFQLGFPVMFIVSLIAVLGLILL